MIQVKLIAATKILGEVMGNKFLALVSHAAGKCYQAESPRMGKLLDVKKRLFETGHHTTLEHFYFTFDVEGIAVSDVTLGLHLASPFYNSDQRSGRFCAEMFSKPDFLSIYNYIGSLWPGRYWGNVISFVKVGVDVYQELMPKAIEIAGNLIAKERSKASAEYIRQNAPKIAQEQLRMFISTIFPTGLDITLDSIALAALYRAAWSPALLNLTRQMADAVLARYPEIGYMFSRRGKNWSPGFVSRCWNLNEIRLKPQCVLSNVNASELAAIPYAADMHPLDLLHFLPEMMNNEVNGIETEVEVSLACLGQDQRHRTIRRGAPEFTRNFYLPPILNLLPLALESARTLMHSWFEIIGSCDPSLAAAVAPYGAMVQYRKAGSLNAVFHEQNKRLCWCAQEEIYHLGRFLRLAIEQRNKDSRLLRVLEPYCFRTGQCAEGGRYCGRDISLRETGDYFPVRQV